MKILKIFLGVVVILVIALVYVRKVNSNLLEDCNASIENFTSPSWGPGPNGVDVQEKVVCKHNFLYNLNPLR
jgi:hypothetical protein